MFIHLKEWGKKFSTYPVQSGWTGFVVAPATSCLFLSVGCRHVRNFI